MNQIQSDAYLEGHEQIAGPFRAAQSLDMPLLQSWVNTCLARDTGIEKKVQLIHRDEAGNIAQTTTISASKAELCGYRLAGAFAAVESFRAELHKKGVTFGAKAPHE